jgi:DsbC/DsbD-like thiol-disulfide interchange protein
MGNDSLIRGLGILFTWATLLSLSLLASAEDLVDQHVKVGLVAAQDELVPGQQLWMAVRFDLQDGWHTYWVNPGDSGEAPRIEWLLPSGFHAGAIQWPYPTRLSTPPFADYGYEHQVLLMAAVQPPSRLVEGKIEKIAARVHYLVCQDVCIPGQKQLELPLPVRTHSSPSAASGLFRSTRQRLPRPVPNKWTLSAISQGDVFILTLRTGKLLRSAQFFPLEAEQIDNAALQTMTAIPGGIRLRLVKSKHLLKPISHLEGVVLVAPGRSYRVDIPIS